MTARGALTRTTAEQLRATTDLLTHAGCSDITIDLAGLTSIDPAGTTLLAALRHSLSTHAGTLTIINASSEISELRRLGQI